MKKLHLYILAVLFVFVSVSVSAQTYDGTVELVAVKAAAGANYWTWGTADTVHRGNFWGSIVITFTLENARLTYDPRTVSVSTVYAKADQSLPNTYSLCRGSSCYLMKDALPESFTMMASGTGPLEFYGRANVSWQTPPPCFYCSPGKVGIQTTTPVYVNNYYTTMPIAPPPPAVAY